MSEWLEYITMPAQSPMADLRRKNGREKPWHIKYWAVGNENWGCGGNMRPQYYADLFRQYQSYCRNFSREKLFKIACGEKDEWNEVILREAARFMSGLSIHYYTVPGTWEHKGSSTNFTVQEWFTTMKKASDVHDFLASTTTLLDKHDPDKRVGIVLDEWGTWHDVEPGTNPGFLYQQNTVRDALVAGLSLNIFNHHAERLHMANIAQTVNVLQAMILTEGPKMLLTPTYHVFEMYKAHQDATLLPTQVECDDYSVGGQDKLPVISASASKSGQGQITLSLCNLHHEKDAELTLQLRGATTKQATARVLKGSSLAQHNTFDNPNQVHPEDLLIDHATASDITLTLPAHSVAVMTFH